MLNYQLLQLNDLSGGITDNYKAVGKGKFKVLKNLITSDNRSLRTRNGTRVYCNTGASVLGMINFNDKTYIATSDSIKYISDGTLSVAASKPTDLTLSFSTSNPPQLIRHKNSVLINGNQNTGDKELLLATLKSGGIFAVRKASLPVIKTLTASGSVPLVAGDRLLAAVVVRKFTDADGLTFFDYGAERIVEWDGTTNPYVSFQNLEEYRDTDDVTYVYFYATQPNGTTFYLGQVKTIAGSATTTNAVAVTITTAVDAGNTEVFSFEQEAIKSTAPVCDYFTMAGGIGWYASIYNSSEKLPYRAIHSVDGIPYSVIQSAYVDFDHPINGVGSINSMPIFLTDECLYRVDGNIGIDNSGFLRKVRVANSEGGISHKGIVIANDKMYYLGTDGIYVTDGYSATNITGPELYKTYSSYVKDKTKWPTFCATFDRDNNIIYWRMAENVLFALEMNTGSMSVLEYPATYNIYSILSAYIKDRQAFGTTTNISDHCTINVDGIPTWTYVLYKTTSARYLSIGDQYEIDGIVGEVDRIFYKDETVTDGGYISQFTLYTTDYDFEKDMVIVKYPFASSPDTAIKAFSKDIYNDTTEYARRLMIGTNADYLMSSQDNDYSDIVIDGTETNNYNLRRTHIDFDMLTAGMSYGSSSLRKWVKELSVTLRTEYKSSVEPYVVVDDNENVAKMKRITSESQGAAYGEDEMFGSESSMAFAKQVISGKRHLPSGFCRCRHNQIGLRSAETDLYSSVDFGKIVITTVDANTVTGLLSKEDEGNDVGVLLPYDLVGKTIVINGERLYISDVSSDRVYITLTKPSIFSVSLNDELDWTIYGYRRDQRIEVLSIDISYALISDSKSGYNQALTPAGEQ